MNYQSLTDLQWQVLEPMFPKPEKRGRGKPHTPWREVLNSILFVLTTKSKWSALPKEANFASKSAAHRWYKTWQKNGFIHQILNKLEELSMLASEISLPPTRNRKPKEHTTIAAQEPAVAVTY